MRGRHLNFHVSQWTSCFFKPNFQLTPLTASYIARRKDGERSERSERLPGSAAGVGYHQPISVNERVLTGYSFSEDTVVLVVGPEKKRLLMHRSHVQRSRFIHATFKDVWAKGSRELELPEDEVNLIRVWLHFLYVSGCSIL